MKKFFLILVTLSILCVMNSVAQVTIGSLATPNATLDVRGQATDVVSSDGIIAPKLTGDQLAAKNAVYNAAQDGALVYVTAAATGANLTSGKTVNVKAPGYYYYNATAALWMSVAPPPTKEWFYMPPTLININATLGTPRTINLFAAYSTAITNSTKVTGTDNFSLVRPVLTAADYDYYVVGYDATLFSNISISSAGVMTYESTGKATDQSYITIVFVRK